MHTVDAHSFFRAQSLFGSAHRFLEDGDNNLRNFTVQQCSFLNQRGTDWEIGVRKYLDTSGIYS